VPLPARDGQWLHAWQARPESARAKRDRQLKVLVRASFTASKGRYASRIHRDLIEEYQSASAGNR
jgi:hypothetical protein